MIIDLYTGFLIQNYTAFDIIPPQRKPLNKLDVARGKNKKGYYEIFTIYHTNVWSFAGLWY